MKKHIQQLLDEKYTLENKLSQVNAQIERLDYCGMITQVINSDDYFTSQADQLAQLLTDRDTPLTYDEIEEIFKASGFEYVGRHISESRPDSIETVEEEKRYWSE